MSERLVLDMDFPERLATLRKERGLTQYALAEAARVNVSQIRRYEGGTSQPTLDVLRRIAVALSVTADLLVFDRDERGPDDDLRLQFEAVSHLDQEEKRVVKEVLEGLIIKYQTRRWDSARQDVAAAQ